MSLLHVSNLALPLIHACTLDTESWRFIVGQKLGWEFVFVAIQWQGDQWVIQELPYDLLIGPRGNGHRCTVCAAYHASDSVATFLSQTKVRSSRCTCRQLQPYTRNVTVVTSLIAFTYLSRSLSIVHVLEKYNSQLHIMQGSQQEKINFRTKFFCKFQDNFRTICRFHKVQNTENPYILLAWISHAELNTVQDTQRQ